MMIFRVAMVGRLVLLLGCLVMIRPAFALLPFPLSANQRGTVACLEKSAITYDIYLPPGYSTNGPPLPIFYTVWSAVLSFDPTTTAGFFRVLTAPLSGTSPPWPVN